MPVKDIPEYLGYQSIKNVSGRNIFTSYWESKKAISLWPNYKTHKIAKTKGTHW
jgi:heme-degrading monooxygenase HmoA